MATLLFEKGSFEDALPFYQRALHGGEAVLGISHPHTIQWAKNFAIALEQQGRRSEARELRAKYRKKK